MAGMTLPNEDAVGWVAVEVGHTDEAGGLADVVDESCDAAGGLRGASSSKAHTEMTQWSPPENWSRSTQLPASPVARQRLEIVYEAEGPLGLQMFRKRGTRDSIVNCATGESALHGVKSGDRVAEVNDTTVLGKSPDAIAKLIQGIPARPLTVVYERWVPKTYLKAVELDEDLSKEPEGSHRGLTLTQQVGDLHCVVSGVSSQAMEEGVQKGDVLLRLDGIDFFRNPAGDETYEVGDRADACSPQQVYKFIVNHKGPLKAEFETVCLKTTEELVDEFVMVAGASASCAM